jgi:hypothetical protein
MKSWLTGSLKLFDLSRDLSESQDLSKKMPEKAQELHETMMDYLKRVTAPISKRELEERDKAEMAAYKKKKKIPLENYWLEAEDADTIVSPFEVANDETASGGKYIFPPNGTGNQYSPGSIMAVYKVNIEQTGKYILWGRVKALDKKDNSFFVQLNNGSNHLWEVEPGNHWHWEKVKHSTSPFQLTFTLTEGTNVINVIMREDGTKLDKLLLTNNLDFVPKDKEYIPGNAGNSEDN